MPLSEREQRLLEQLEQQLNAEDPSFATSMSETGTVRFSTRNLIIGSLSVVVGLGVLLWGVSQQAIWLGLIGLVVLAVGITVATSRPRGGKNGKGGRGGKDSGRPAEPTGGGSGSHKSTPFMENLEQRWDERRRQDP